jgi:hypothetical protein
MRIPFHRQHELRHRQTTLLQDRLQSPLLGLARQRHVVRVAARHNLVQRPAILRLNIRLGHLQPPPPRLLLRKFHRDDLLHDLQPARLHQQVHDLAAWNRLTVDNHNGIAILRRRPRRQQPDRPRHQNQHGRPDRPAPDRKQC